MNARDRSVFDFRDWLLSDRVAVSTSEHLNRFGTGFNKIQILFPWCGY